MESEIRHAAPGEPEPIEARAAELPPDLGRAELRNQLGASPAAAADANIPPKRYGSRDAALVMEPGRRPRKEVYVPVWDAWYIVQGMTGQERDYYEKSVTIHSRDGDRIDITDARAKLVQLTVIEPDGKLMFSPADIGMLSRQPALALEPLFDAARELSGMTERDWNELTANFPSDRNGSSTSG